MLLSVMLSSFRSPTFLSRTSAWLVVIDRLVIMSEEFFRPVPIFSELHFLSSGLIVHRFQEIESFEAGVEHFSDTVPTPDRFPSVLAVVEEAMASWPASKRRRWLDCRSRELRATCRGRPRLTNIAEDDAFFHTVANLLGVREGLENGAGFLRGPRA